MPSEKRQPFFTTPNLSRFRITTKGDPVKKQAFGEKLLATAPIIISAITLISTIVFSFVITKEREYSKIRYDQQMLTYSKLLDIARELKGETGRNVDSIYNINLSKFDMICSGELQLIAEQEVIDDAEDFREAVSEYNSNLLSTRKLDVSYKALVKALKASMENTKK